MVKRARLEGQLRFSQKMEAMGLLAGGVAHEFNNLLTTIGIYADLLLEHPSIDPTLREEAEQIRKAGRQASTLTQQLLTFSRKRTTRTELLDLDDIVREVSSMLRRLVGEDSELVCRFDDPPHPIRANREELEQVLVNLALNARDAMPAGGTVTIETSTMRRADLPVHEIAGSLTDDEYVVLSMTDTGIGMDSEILARVFDPFFTTRQVEKGTGLGLSIVYGIMHQAGGTVRVQSEPGHPETLCASQYLPPTSSRLNWTGWKARMGEPTKRLSRMIDEPARSRATSGLGALVVSPQKQSGVLMANPDAVVSESDTVTMFQSSS